MKYKPYDYQKYATEHIVNHTEAALFLEMGLGKSVITLTAIESLIYDHLEVDKVLVIAPKRVAEHTWSTEAQKWDHLKHLRISKVLGDEKNRKTALKAKADIYVINRENVPWLVGFYASAWPFKMVVIDESSSFKSHKARRFKALRMIRPKIIRVVCLTGTPRPNTMLDLWAQLYLLDRGQRLGETFTGFRDKYFKPGKRNGHVVYSYDERKPDKKEIAILGADIFEKEVYGKISDICISMKTADYLQLPEKMERVVPVHLPAKTMDAYLKFEEEQVMLLAESEITAVNAAALTTKLLQFANGAIYDENGDFHEVHNEKLDALEEILDVADGNPVLVFYTYKHDKARIQHHLKKYEPVELHGSKEINDWNEGKIKLMVAHPASAGHGLNLQAGGNIIVWFGHTWSLELYLQANARLYRQGQLNAVIIHRLAAVGTIDSDVMEALERKAGGQEALMNAVKARVKKYLTEHV